MDECSSTETLFISFVFSFCFLDFPKSQKIDAFFFFPPAFYFENPTSPSEVALRVMWR